MKWLYSFVVCFLIFSDCLASPYSSRNRGHDEHREKGHGHSQHQNRGYDEHREKGHGHSQHQNHDHDEHREKGHGHSLHHYRVKMPSGTMESIIQPYKCSQFKCGDHAKRIFLKRHGKVTKKEYYAVKREMLGGATTGVQFKISKIEKIINPCLWSKYWYRKQSVRSEANMTNEIMLFHASSANRLITDLGFDERYAKLGPYGAGLYFSVNATKIHELSKPKPDGTRVYSRGGPIFTKSGSDDGIPWKSRTTLKIYRNLLLCRVALGKSYETAPTKLAHAPVGYQSVKGQGSASEDYVIYRGEQAYPEYLITYET